MKNTEELKSFGTVKKQIAGITLIALVITIIVILILAGVSISMISGNNGILAKAGQASEAQKDAVEEEKVKMAVITARANDTLGNLTDENLKNAITNEFGSPDGLTGTGPWTYEGERNIYNIDGDGEITRKPKLTPEEAEKIVDVLGSVDDVTYVLTAGGEVKPTTITPGNIFGIVQITGEAVTTDGVKKGNINCFIDNKGKVYTCGNNGDGQLGNGTTTYSSMPICISDIPGSALNGKNIVDIYSCGYGCTVLAKDSNGKIYSWGRNEYGELGNRTTTNSSMPICISDIEGSALNEKNIVDIYSDGYTVLAKDSNGKIYSWGGNYSGQLGDGTTICSNMPICISDKQGSALNGKNIVDIYSDGYTVLAKDSNGKIYSWGSNEYEELENGTTEDSSMPICISDIPGSALNGKNIVDIYTSGATVLAKDSNGKIYSWGYNKYGQLGAGTDEEYSDMPICISDIAGSALNGKNIVDIYNDDDDGYTVLVKDSNGKIYSWGENYSGQLGDGTTICSNMPICISDKQGSALNGKNIVDIYFDGHTVLAKDSNGKIYSWGANNSGQLGDGTTTSSNMPICISDIANSELKNKKIKRVKMSKFEIYYITEEGECFFIEYLPPDTPV